MNFQNQKQPFTSFTRLVSMHLVTGHAFFEKWDNDKEVLKLFVAFFR